MSCNSSRCRFNACSCCGILISVIIAAIVAVLFAFYLIPFIEVIVFIALGLAVLTFIILIIGIFLTAVTLSIPLQKCVCKNALCMLVGIIGTIILAIIALAFPLIPSLVFSIIVIALGAFFFALMIIGLLVFVVCLLCKLCS